MEVVRNALDWPMLMDILALGTSMVLIGWLILNRVRYGHLLAAPQAATADFASEMTMQMVTQQSRRSYRNIEQTLHQEFDNLRRLTGGDQHLGLGFEKRSRTEGHRSNTGEAGRMRVRSHDQAVRMIQNGADQQDIARRCGLARSEIDLMSYMQHKRR